MIADCSIECGANDPALVVPWQAEGAAHAFIDLRTHSDAHVPEAEEHPPLLQALRSLNAPRSPVFTVKCDTWHMTPEEIAPLQLELDFTEEDAAAGFASYIDLIWRDRAIFASMHRQQQLLQRIIRYAASLEAPNASLELTLRPALIDLTAAQEGFATTLYVKAIAATSNEAWQRWATALGAVVALLRNTQVTGSA